MHLSGAVDFAAELARLEKEPGKIDKELGGLNQKLANEGFVSRAPPKSSSASAPASPNSPTPA